MLSLAMTGQLQRLSPMRRRVQKTSRRLFAAASAEREQIAREEEQLLAQRELLQQQLGELDADLAELRERLQLLDRLTDTAPQSEQPAAPAEPAATNARVLRGPEIRQIAVKLLLADRRRPQALHYREWYALMEAEGYVVAGKDPRAVFLTQLSRSPVVIRGTQSGVYSLNLEAIDRLRARLEERKRELRSLTQATSATTDLGDLRRERTALTQEINKLEKSLEEALATLGDRDHPVAVAS
jgi:chromosome segregation ATPase